MTKSYDASLIRALPSEVPIVLLWYLRWAGTQEEGSMWATNTARKLNVPGSLAYYLLPKEILDKLLLPSRKILALWETLLKFPTIWAPMPATAYILDLILFYLDKSPNAHQIHDMCATFRLGLTHDSDSIIDPLFLKYLELSPWE